MAPSSSPSPSPSLSPSPSKKLLIADPKPKSKPVSGPPNSASSSSTTAAQPPEKRTRDQPNLSDCHCCGRRINYSNPKDRLQPLDSVWRVVLLCGRCRKNFQSGQTCPYCFREAGNLGNLFTCGACGRKVHKDCVRDYGNCTPWCYLVVKSEGFRVCVDCWVPELLKNSTGFCGKSENKGGLKDKCESRDLVEKVVKGAKCEVEKKVKTVEKGKEQVQGEKVARNAVNLVNVESDSLAEKDKDGAKAENSNSSGSIEVVDDAELAIQLHRAINSSPRILRSKSLGSLNAVDVLKISDWKGLSYKRSRFGKNRTQGQQLGTCVNSVETERMDLPGQDGPCIAVNRLNLGLLCYKRDRKRKVWQLNEENTVISESRSNQPAYLNFNLHSDDARTSSSMKSSADMSEASNCVNTDNGRTTVDRFGLEPLIYKRTRFKKKVCQVNGLVGVSGDSSSCDNHEVVLKSENCQSDDAKLRTGCPVKSDNEMILPIGSCDAERDRYQLKYGKRVKGIKSDSNFLCYGAFLSENLASIPVLSNSGAGCLVKCDDELILPNGTSCGDPDRYCFKYTKRVKGCKSSSIFETKLHSSAFMNGIEAAVPGLMTNCSAESRTLSDVSFDLSKQMM